MSDFVTAQRHSVTLANGDRVPALGQGTWYLGDSRAFPAPSHKVPLDME